MSISSEGLNLQTIQQVLDLMPNPVSFNRRVMDNKGMPYDEILYVNQEFKRTIGYSVDDIPTDRVWFDKAYPDKSYQAFVLKEWFDSLENAKIHKKSLPGVPAKVLCKDGSEKWFQITSHIESNIADNCHLIVFVEIDTPDDIILELQSKSQLLIEKNQALLHSEIALKQTQKNAQVGSWELDLKGGTLHWSEEMYNIYGEDPNTFKPSMENFFSRLSKEDIKLIQNGIEHTLSTGEPSQGIVNILKHDNTFLTLQIFGKALFNDRNQPIKIIGSTLDITRKTQLEKENDELARLVKLAQQEMYVVDFDTNKYLYVNESASANTGYSIEELLDFTIFDINPLLTPEHVVHLKKLGSGLDRMTNISLHKRKDGSTYPVHATLQRVMYKGRECFAIFDADITELQEAQNALKTQLNLLHTIVDNVPVRIFWKDRESRYLGANKLFLQDTQLASEEDLIGKTDEMIWGDEQHAAAFREDDLLVMNSGQPRLHFEEPQKHKDGKTIILSTSKVPLKDANDNIVGILGTYIDITKQRNNEQMLIKQQESLHYQAHHDALTELPNRILLEGRINEAIQHSKRTGQKFALLFLDLDQFKQINDSMGHDIGDKVLIDVSKKFFSKIRYKDTLARIGGDEFTIIMNNVEHTSDIADFAKKLIKASKEPVVIDGQIFYLSSSVGISIYPKDGQTPDSLLKCADSAMYRAKEQGRDNYQFYTKDMTQAAFEHVAMQASLRQAISQNEFVIHYQPQINAAQNKIVGMEALVRWMHPVLGLVMPDTFIPLAESTGMIVDLDRVVMRTAMQQWTDWQQAGINPGILSINLAAKQLQRVDFIDFLQDCMQSTQCKPEWLVFELTESDIMTNLDVINHLLIELGQLGITFAIDDFGTGYSSLAYLKRLPVTKLKIDRSFVKDLPQDEEDCTITKTIISMAASLGLEVLAEGVETSEQRDFLLKNGCDLIQGYFFARPIGVESVANTIKPWL